MERAAAESRLDVWTAESGLPLNTVRAILQTRDGYLWVGTLDGLARFDGVRFTVFNKATSPGLTANGIMALCEDREDNLWIALSDGNLARLHRGVFTTYGTQHGLPGAPILTVVTNNQDGLWLVAADAPFFWKNSHSTPDSVVSAALPPPRMITGSRAGILWSTNLEGLHIYSRGTVTMLDSSNGLPSVRINQVDEDQHGTWWVATEDAGLLKIRDGKVVRTYTKQDGLPSNTVRPRAGALSPAVACEDSRGNLWIAGAGPWLGCLKDGVFIGYPSTNAPTAMTLRLTPGLPGSDINVIFEDREGNLWIGTEGSGLIRAREQIINPISSRQGLHAVNTYPVLEDRSGAVWLGTWELGLARIKAGVVTNFALGWGYGDVTALCEDHVGHLWVGTMGGVFIFDKDQVSLAGVPAALTNRAVRAICEDRNEALWFGADSDLACYRNGEISWFTERDGLAGGLISAIIEGRAGSLWIGSRGGLTRLADLRFTVWTERDGLPSNRVPGLYEDAQGTLWIGTSDGGLGRFKDERFTRYTTREGMFDNGVFQILEDATGNFWMSSNRGIQRVSKKELNEFAEGRRRTITSVAYGKSDGMLNPECNGGCWPDGVKTRDGKLWFPTQDGVAVIDPGRIVANPKPPPAVIESFVIDRRPLMLDGPLRVPPGKADIEIHYTGLSFVNSERLLFKYRLSGGEDWIEAGTRRAAYFSRLAPGKYTFNVVAANSDGVWNQAGASLGFEVLPAWYQTWWFRPACAAGIAGVLGIGYRRRIARLERARATEREFSRRLMQSQEQDRQRLAAELHDSLGQNLVLMKNLALLDQISPANQEKPAQRSAEIAAAADRALEEVHAISYALRPPELDRLGLAKAIGAMVRRASQASRIQFQTHIEFEGALRDGSDIQFFRIAQEAVNNLVKHSGAKTARVELWEDEAGVHLVVADDGRGLNAGQTDMPEKRSGLGLAGIEERSRLIGGQCKWFSSPGQGTTLSVLVPGRTSAPDTTP